MSAPTTAPAYSERRNVVAAARNLSVIAERLADASRPEDWSVARGKLEDAWYLLQYMLGEVEDLRRELAEAGEAL